MRTSAVTLAIALATVPGNQAPSPLGPPGNPERGRYLVEHVAMCVECHTPRDEHGQLLRSELFMGAPVPVNAPGWAQDWALKAPRIAGLPGYDEQAALQLYTRGIGRSGQPLRPPMPQFRLNEQDARDIYAYLKSFR